MKPITIESIKEKLIDQIALSIGEEPSNIQPDMLMHELGMDSLGLVELFVFIEKEFKFNLMESGISQEDIMQIDSLAQSIDKAINK
ncbi:MAG: acyl carrier protein [Desulfobacteraceae bacterium]|nr:acyl carrier protein [Desulfobacteraceae bacterium]